MADESHALANDQVQRILDAIATVNVSLARVEARIDSLMRDTKDHEGRIHVLEHDQSNVLMMKSDIEDHIKGDVIELNAKVDGLTAERDSVRGFMKAIAIITPAVSGVITFGIMVLVKVYAG